MLIGNENDVYDDISFYQYGAERLTIYAGNVGIGTTAPANKLHVYAQNNEGILIGTPYHDNENVRKNSIDFLAWRDSYNGDNRFIGASISTERRWVCCNGWPSSGYPGVALTDLIFGTRDSWDISVPPTERMRITYNGNVGIGTTAPGAKLEIYDTGTIKTGIFDRGSDANFNIYTRQDKSSNESGALIGELGLAYETTPNAAIRFHRGGGVTGGFITFTTNNGT